MTLYGSRPPIYREPVRTVGQPQTFGPPWLIPANLLDIFGGNLLMRTLGVVPLGVRPEDMGQDVDLTGGSLVDRTRGVVPLAAVGRRGRSHESRNPNGNSSHLQQPTTPLDLLRTLFPFLPATPMAITTEGRVNFVDPRIEALPFGLTAIFRVRNDSRLPGRFIPRVRVTSLQFRTERDRWGPRIELAPGQESAPIRVTHTNLRQDRFAVELALLDEATRMPVNSLVQNVDLTVGRQPLGAAAGAAVAVSAIYTGTVRFADGLNIPAGFVLSARVGGRSSGQVPIHTAGSFGFGTPALVVRNSEAMAGDPVTFFINSFQAVETAPYQPGGFPQRLTLTFPRA